MKKIFFLSLLFLTLTSCTSSKKEASVSELEILDSTARAGEGGAAAAAKAVQDIEILPE